VKKLIALLLVVAFVCAGSIGCGDSSKDKAGGAGSSNKADSGKKP
jgi:hypothetical protein